MNAKQVKVAKAVAGARGWTGRRGGWIYDAAGNPIAQGWQAIYTLLLEKGFVTDQGIWWRRMDLANFH